MATEQKTTTATPAGIASPENQESPQTSIDVSQATPVAPTEAPTKALDPLSGAGVLLTKIVLGMMSAVLFLLILALIYQEERVSDLSDQLMHVTAARTIAMPTVGVLEPALASLRLAEKSGPAEARSLLDDAATKLGSLREPIGDRATVEQLSVAVQNLAKEAQGRQIDPKAIRDVISLAQAATDKGVIPSATVEELKTRQELMKTQIEAANASREFWLKMAQLILLNLLLPILTALLGYVFASKNGK